MYLSDNRKFLISPKYRYVLTLLQTIYTYLESGENTGKQSSKLTPARQIVPDKSDAKLSTTVILPSSTDIFCYKANNARSVVT